VDTLKGICGSRGYCFGNAVVKTNTMPSPVKGLVLDYADEIAKFRRAQNIYFSRLEKLAEMTSRTLGNEAADIFRAYQVIVKDEAFFKNAFSRIEKDSISIEFAVDLECKKIVSMFDSMGDDYMRERAIDIENVCSELIHIMMGVDSDFSHKMEGKSDIVLVAGNLTPAETVKIDKSRLRGIVTEMGGVTSHTVILARALNIPAIVGVEGATLQIRDGDFVTLDGFTGEIDVNPSGESREVFFAVKQMHDLKRRLYSLAEKAPAVTTDGFQVSVSTTAGDYESVRKLDISRCDGIGLFRTESPFLYSNTYPSEEKQFLLYKEAAERAEGKEVIFRTLDMGGVSQAGYMNLPVEENPVIGFRAIRLSLKKKDVFDTQLRAILRASAFGDVKIMFPMIATLEELLHAKERLEAAKQELKDAAIPYRGDIPVGVMIHTPAAALISDILARECDFFSIGSNDFVQNITAADRLNPNVEELYDFCSLPVLRAVRIVAENAGAAGIGWMICGEAASDERLVPLWVAMGAAGLTVPPSQAGAIKHMICGIGRAEMQKELETVLNMSRTQDIRAHMDNVIDPMV